MKYRATINGFWCHNETWDDLFNWDGKHDEVFFMVNTKVADKATGTIKQNLDSESATMGDVNGFVGRVRAGAASGLGGIISGDRFPTNTPWRRDPMTPLGAERFPPYVIWEGDLHADSDMVFITPTIWEWDPGQGALDGWAAWQVGVDAKFGQRAKDIFGKIWPVANPVFDAVSLGSRHSLLCRASGPRLGSRCDGRSASNGTPMIRTDRCSTPRPSHLTRRQLSF